jgi:hypothetical protein
VSAPQSEPSLVQNLPQSEALALGDSISTDTVPEGQVSTETVPQATTRGGFRGRFRGGSSGRDVYRGRGRFAGRIIRGRNKTWVRGPGADDPLSTER